MNQTILTAWLTQLLQNYNSHLTCQPGTHEWETIISPLLLRFGNDPLMASPSAFVQSTLAAKFPELALDELQANADIFAIPLEVLMETVRRELRQCQITTSLKYPTLLTTDELEALLTSTRVPRQTGRYATVTVRAYFSTPRFVEVPLNAVAFTGDGLEFVVNDLYTFQADAMVEQREDQYYYVDIPFVAANPGTRYNVAPDAIRGISNLPGLVYARNPWNGENGDDEESMLAYLQRVRAEVSERAGDTKPGITKLVEDGLGTFEVQAVGKGETYMYRDIARWQLDNEDLQITVLDGTSGDLVEDGILFGILPSPWTNTITNLSPEIPVLEPAAEQILIGGDAYAVAEGTFADGVPLSEVTFQNYAPIFGAPTALTNRGYAISAGAACPQSIGFAVAEGDLPALGELGGTLWAWTDRKPFTGDVPASIVCEALSGGYLWGVTAAQPLPGFIHVAVTPAPTLLRRSYTDVYVLEVTPTLSGTATIRYGTWDGATFTPVAWQGSPEIPEEDVWLAAEFTLAGAKYLLMAVTLAEDGTLTGTIPSLGDPPPIVNFETEYPTYMTVAEFDAAFPGPDPVLLTTTGDCWSLYALEVFFDHPTECALPAGPLELVVVRQEGDALLPYTADPQSWSLTRKVTNTDLRGTLLLPDGTSMDTAGNIPLGGCTDIFLYSPPADGRTFTLQDFPDLDVVLEEDNAAWDEISGPEGLLTVPGASAAVRTGDTLTLTHPEEGGSYLVLAVLGETDVVSVDHAFAGTGTDVPFVVHRLMRASLSESRKVILAGDDMTCGLTARVAFAAALPALVEVGQTLRILAGPSADDYTILARGTNYLDLDAPTVFVETDVGYQILAEYPAPTLPLATISGVKALTAYVSPEEPGGSPTGINLGYRLPLRIEARGDSLTNGPDTRLPLSAGYTGDVTADPVVDYQLGHYGVLTWTADFREYDVFPGDVLVLNGRYNNGCFYILDLDEIEGPLYTAKFIYIGPSRATQPHDEIRVPFGIYARHLVNLRLYFETPPYAELGRVNPDTEIIGEVPLHGAFGLTTFTAAGKTYIVNPINEQELTLDATAGIEGIRAGAPEGFVIFSSATTNLRTWRLFRGDGLRVLTVPLRVTNMSDPCPLSGTALTLAVDGTNRTLQFRGTNPVAVDSETGFGGVKQQLEAAFPVTVIVTEGEPGKKHLKLLSTTPLTVVGGGALNYLPGLTGSNVPAYAGEYEVSFLGSLLEPSANELYCISENPEALATFPESATEMLLAVIRKGRVVTKPSEFAQAYGFYCVDVEAVSLNGGPEFGVAREETFTLGGEYLLSGFSLQTDAGLSFSERELAELVLTPYAPDANGELVGLAEQQFKVDYATVPLVSLLQTMLTGEKKRVTADDTLAKAKPVMRLGVGPLVSTTTMSWVELAAAVNARLSETLTTRTYLTLGDLLSWLAPYGIAGTADTRLIVYYEDLDRTRKLLLAPIVTVNRLWHLEADPQLFVSA